MLQPVFDRPEEAAINCTRKAPYNEAHVANPFYLGSELPSNKQPPQELPLVQIPSVQSRAIRAAGPQIARKSDELHLGGGGFTGRVCIP